MSSTTDLRLTAREREILAALARGRTPADIAEQLAISRHTVGHHVSHLLGKLGAHNRAHAVVIAVQRGLIDIDLMADR